ncbi:unnamed protein product [Ilex paraguariensis]|uniref:TPX2 C-terminal domain-containing protein n=1 Tax=Ilex paraguariensis TaxID=185542 RepID=A0ABC8QZC0_9AQUA
MGESMVEAPIVENKMGESIVSGGTLEVSVSFGRFENDSLSWEKWSSFSPNKYLEEVEKCSTPGSVAQKKAYFEAHYKKIAARKAELLDQPSEQQDQEKKIETEPEPSRSGDPNCKDDMENIYGTDTEFSVSNGPSPAEEIGQYTDSVSVVSCINVDEPKEDFVIALECQNLLIEEAKEELDGKVDGDALSGPEEGALDKEETFPNGSLDVLVLEQPPEVDKVTVHRQEDKVEDSKLDAQNTSQKIASIKRELNLAGTKKKPLSPVTKPRQLSTPKVSKPMPTSPATPASRSSTKKANGLLLPRSKNPSMRESKRAAPTSLHMSLSLGPTNSDSVSLSTTRKSLIMEKMGDKDIVKRAFKTFQNNLNQLRSSSDEKSCRPKQVSTGGSQQKVSGSITPRKENSGMRKAAENMNAHRGFIGTRTNSISSASPKAVHVNGRNEKAASSPIAFRGNERAEKQKEFLKKLEVKSYAQESAKTRLSSKMKEEKEAEIKKLRQSLNFKATPLPGFYRGQGMSKSCLEKDGAKNEVRH